MNFRVLQLTRKKSLRDLSSQPLQIPLYLTQSMSEISSELDNPQELRNRKAELRLKMIKLKADWIKRKMKYTRITKLSPGEIFVFSFSNVKLKLITTAWTLKTAAVSLYSNRSSFNQLKLYVDLIIKNYS